ncbi:MAG TPA: DUF5723 family protein [Flavobacteriales bacterium]
MRAALLPGLWMLSASLFAQERYGLLHSNYAGMDAIVLNPARAAGQWPWMDIRLAGAEAYAWNSLVAWTDRRSPLITEVRNGFEGMENGRVVMRSLDFQRSHRATVTAAASGPAVSLSLGRGTLSAGIRTRAHVSASGISREIGNFILNGLDHAPQHGIRYDARGMRVLGAGWTETGVNYAHILHARGFSLFSAGVGVRYLMGHTAGALQITSLDHTVYDSARLDLHSITARYGYAEPSLSAGRGFGGDVGFVYERTLSEVDGYRPHKDGSCTPMEYRYRIGLSVIDLGGIRFADAAAGTLDTGALSIADYNGIDLDGAEAVDSLLASATNWSRRRNLAIGMPTAVSLQYDQRIAEHAYVALAAVHGLSGRNGLRLRRANSLAITPRFETRYVEFALPVVLNEYDLSRPMIGAMLRMHGLVLGSDHILPFISKRDVHAMDLYVRVRWLIYRSPACRKGGGRSIIHRGKARDMMPCSEPGS